MKLLIADDNDQSLYLLRTLLEQGGHEVHTASDGAEALAQAGRLVPDAIVSDILMPRVDGFALCRAVRQNDAWDQVAFLLYTATYTDPADRDFGLSVGADRFLEKPTEPAELLAEIEAAVAERRSGRARRAGAGPEERSYLREYNARLVRKLEDKMLELERAYRELADSERRYHELFDVASDVIFTLSPDGTIALINRRVLETLGYHPAELTGKPYEAYVAPSHRARARETFQKVIDGQRMTMEFDLLAADGRVVPMHIVSVPLWQGLKPSGVMGIARDMTERQRSESAKLDDARREATGMARRDVADEFEGPLVQVLSGLRELARRPTLGEDSRVALAALEAELSRMVRSLHRPEGTTAR